MTYYETLLAMGIVKISDEVLQHNTINMQTDTMEELASKSRCFGIYADDQFYAKLLALSLGSTEPPESHYGAGAMAHYHDAAHTIHIWYGKSLYFGG